MTTIKESMDAQWRNPGVHHAGHLVAWEANALSHSLIGRAGTARSPQPDKETKRRRAGLAMYNEKLRPIILAEATKTDGVYRWPKTETPVIEQAPAIPRKRVPKAKLEQAAAIIAKVPPNELAAFLAKFGLSLSLAASIASLDNAEMIARQFLRATL
jgi:hypothetical protein